MIIEVSLLLSLAISSGAQQECLAVGAPCQTSDDCCSKVCEWASYFGGSEGENYCHSVPNPVQTQPRAQPEVQSPLSHSQPSIVPCSVDGKQCSTNDNCCSQNCKTVDWFGGFFSGNYCFPNSIPHDSAPLNSPSQSQQCSPNGARCQQGIQCCSNFCKYKPLFGGFLGLHYCTDQNESSSSGAQPLQPANTPSPPAAPLDQSQTPVPEQTQPKPSPQIPLSQPSPPPSSSANNSPKGSQDCAEEGIKCFAATDCCQGLICIYDIAAQANFCVPDIGAGDLNPTDVPQVVVPSKPRVNIPLYNSTFQGLSYSPHGIDPFCLSESEVQRDLENMLKLTKRIRIYGISTCLARTKQMLSYAKQNGMKIGLGLYFSEKYNFIDDEIEALGPLAADYGDTIEFVIAGNEIYFVEAMKLDTIITLIRRVKQKLTDFGSQHIPVALAEVWPTWVKQDGARLLNEVDIGMLNIQPYWEGKHVQCPPSPGHKCSDAGEYVWEVFDRLENLYGRQFLLSETGWPSDGPPCCVNRIPYADFPGNQTLLSTASIDNQNYYIQTLDQGSKSRQQAYYFFEYVDADWKRQWAPCLYCDPLPKPCTGCLFDYHYGLYTSNRETKPLNIFA